MSTDTNDAIDKNFSQRMTDVEITLVKMEQKIEKIYDALLGNEKFDQMGLISRLKTLEKENDGYRALKNKIIGAFFIGGVSWTIIWELSKKVLFNK